jgi:hypothetical protein
MAFHHHMGTIVETDDEIDALMARTGEAVGLLFDTGHCAFSGGDPKALLQRHVRRVVHVHCKDVRPAMLTRARAEDMSFMGAVVEGIFTVPGDGSIDYAALLEMLADNGYEGWLVVEVNRDPAKAHPLTYATMATAISTVSPRCRLQGRRRAAKVTASNPSCKRHARGAVRYGVVEKSFSGPKALRGLDLSLPDGRSSPCWGRGWGKTTLGLAGLETSDLGPLLIATDVTRLQPRDRDIAMVFQTYALYPT